jgi:signal transduction histidine kinase
VLAVLHGYCDPAERRAQEAGNSVNFRGKPGNESARGIRDTESVYEFNHSRRKQTQAQLRSRLEGSLAERERIARELHDTFLQAVQGLILLFQSVAERIPTQEPSRKLMEDALSRAVQVIADGRNVIMSLRTASDADLSPALRVVGEELARDVAGVFELFADEKPMQLHPCVQEEAYRIGAEALANAFRHAHATRITVYIEHARRGLILRVVDDGCGFDTSEDHESAGHWGLCGMRERAARIQARLNIRSCIGEGTLVELNVPRGFAYVRSESHDADRRA